MSGPYVRLPAPRPGEEGTVPPPSRPPFEGYEAELPHVEPEAVRMPLPGPFPPGSQSEG